MKKLVTKISVMSLIGLAIVGYSNKCFAGSEGVGLYPMSITNTHKNQDNKESIKLQQDQGFINLLKIDYENEKSKIKYNYIFGLFLDFSEGNISIRELEAEVKKRASICRDKEKELIKKDSDKIEKLLAETTRQVWEKYEKAVTQDKKRLQNKEISIGKLQKDYKWLAVTWFSSQYGIGKKTKNQDVARNLSEVGNTNSKIGG